MAAPQTTSTLLSRLSCRAKDFIKLFYFSEGGMWDALMVFLVTYQPLHSGIRRSSNLCTRNGYPVLQLRLED